MGQGLYWWLKVAQLESPKSTTPMAYAAASIESWLNYPPQGFATLGGFELSIQGSNFGGQGSIAAHQIASEQA